MKAAARFAICVFVAWVAGIAIWFCAAVLGAIIEAEDGRVVYEDAMHTAAVLLAMIPAVQAAGWVDRRLKRTRLLGKEGGHD